MDKIQAWHFVSADRKLRNGRPLVIGKRLTHTGAIKLCESGYHASLRAIDALVYAPGPVICRVEIENFVQDKDKLAARYRTALWAYDATDVLRVFTRSCALDVIDKWACPEIMRQWLLTGDESLRSAAESAALSAALSTARYTALSTARYAARSAARYAALSAAWYAADSAALSAAWYAARAADSAARYAADNAALSAACTVQNTRLEEMLLAGRP